MPIRHLITSNIHFCPQITIAMKFSILVLIMVHKTLHFTLRNINNS